VTGPAFERIVEKLEAARRNGTRAVARCPAHDDRNPSLSITSIEGQALVHCHAGCDVRDVLAKIGLELSDLFDDRGGATYRYDDGRIVHRAYDQNGRKRFYQSGNTNGQRAELFRLGRVRQAVADGSTVWFVEGEKDVLALESLGETATTAPQGAANVDKCDLSPLNGGRVIAVIDKDKAGQKWAGQLAGMLAGKASVEFAHAAEGKDAADHIAAGHGLGEFVAVELEPQPEPGDYEFWNARPILTHIRNFARARRVGPWALLGCVLVRVAAAVPPNVLLPALIGGYASLNLYVGIVSVSGGGKGTAENASLDVIDLPQIPIVGPGSGEGIGHLFYKWDRKEQKLHRHTSAVIISAAEIDTLAALKARQASTLFPELRKAWIGEPLGFAYVNAEKRLIIPRHSYRLCLITGVQPANASPILDDHAAGTPQRFLWLLAEDPDAPDERPAEPEQWPDPLWTPSRAIDPALVSPEDPDDPAQVVTRVMKVCDTAKAEIDGARLDQLRGNTPEALDGHALLAQLKIAAALALLDGRTAEITDKDWRLAGVVRAVSDHTRQQVIDTLRRKARANETARAFEEGRRDVIKGQVVRDDEIQRACQAITRKLRREGAWVAGKIARDAIAKNLRHQFMEAVDKLVETGQIEIENIDHNSQQGMRLRLKEGAR
jgi:hypothetical protein